MVVLPAPVGPTIATVCPGCTSRLKSSISGLSGSYRKHTCSSVTCPAHRGPAGDRRGALGWLLRRIEELEHPLGRGQAGLQQVHLAGDLRDRHRELARVLDERD